MKLSLLTVALLGIAVPFSYGSVLAPGSTAAPDIFSNSSGFTLLATTGAVNLNPQAGVSFNATYQENVVRDVNNVFCIGCLDFLILVPNAGPGTIERIFTSSFTGFSTDVGYNSTSGGVAPSTVDRGANGSVIGFNFPLPGAAIGTGQGSAILVIETNATNFTTGAVSVQDGVTAAGTGYAPSAIPEPTSMILLGTGIIVVVGWRKMARLVV